MKRFLTLDALRGAAALTIVLRHVGLFFGDIYNDTYSYLAVDLFFILSGFVIGNAYEQRLLSNMSAGEFILIRLIRLYPLYFLAWLLAIAGLLMGGRYHIETPENALLLVSVASLFMLPTPFFSKGMLYPNNGALWSLLLELAGNIAYAVTAKWLTTKVLIFITAVSALLLIIAVAISKTGSLNVGFTLKTLPVGLLRFAFSFSVGLLLHRLYNRRNQASTISTLVPLCAVVCLCAILLFPGVLSRIPSTLFVLGVEFVAFPALVWYGAHYEPTPKLAKIFFAAGAASYALYVCHRPLATIVERLTGLLHFPLAATVPYFGFAFTAFAFAFAFLADIHFDMPVRAWLRQKLLKPRRTGPSTANTATN